MPAEIRDARAETTQVLHPWSTPLAEGADEIGANAALWLSGGAVLLLWTAVALLLTAS